jgi:hypothetical protein
MEEQPTDQAQHGPVKFVLNSCQAAWKMTGCLFVRLCFIPFLISMIVVMFSARGYGQEAIRMSLASEQTAEAQRATTSANYYNIQSGPVYLRFQGEMGIELNDNANYSGTAPDADMDFRPNLNLRAFWPVTEQNTLALSAGVGYVEYIRDRNLSHLSIASDSGLAFNVYSGDFVFNLHDRFSALDYQTQDASVSASLIRLENTTGLATTWDLNKLILSAGYDHDIYHALTGNYAYSDNSSELFDGKAAFLVSSTSKLGLEAGGGLTTYDQNVLDNSTHFSVGPFYQTEFTPHLSGEVSAGLASYQFAHNGTVEDVSDFFGYYARLSVTHQLSDSFSQSLSAGRQIQLGITANLSEDYFVSYQATWGFIRNVVTTFKFEYYHGNTSGGLVETYDRYGPGLTLAWRISEKLQASVAYNFLDLKADVAGAGYTQNRLLLDFTYDF